MFNLESELRGPHTHTASVLTWLSDFDRSRCGASGAMPSLGSAKVLVESQRALLIRPTRAGQGFALRINTDDLSAPLPAPRTVQSRTGPSLGWSLRVHK